MGQLAMVASGRRVCADCKGWAWNGKTVCSRCMTKRIDRNRQKREAAKSLWTKTRERSRKPPVVLERGEYPTIAPQGQPHHAPERRTECRRYTKCLSHAERSNWDSFTCRECKVNDDLTRDEKLAEVRPRGGYEDHSWSCRSPKGMGF